MMKKEAARLCGNARMAGHFALHEQENRGIIKKQYGLKIEGKMNTYGHSFVYPKKRGEKQ